MFPLHDCFTTISFIRATISSQYDKPTKVGPFYSLLIETYVNMAGFVAGFGGVWNKGFHLESVFGGPIVGEAPDDCYLALPSPVWQG